MEELQYPIFDLCDGFYVVSPSKKPEVSKETMRETMKQANLRYFESDDFYSSIIFLISIKIFSSVW